MKKCLLTIIAGALVSMSAMAQYVDSLWAVDDNTTQVTALTGLTPTNNYDTDISGDVITPTAPYSYTWVENDEVLKIDFVNPRVEDTDENYNDFTMLFIQWEDVAGTRTSFKFKKDTLGADQDYLTARGYTVDFTSLTNQIVTMKVQADKALNLRLDLRDIAGKTSNGESPRIAVAATDGGADASDDTKWETLTYSWSDENQSTPGGGVTVIEDWYSGDWWGVKYEGFRDPQVPLDASKIAGIVLLIDDAKQGSIGSSKTLYIKDIKVGAEGTVETYSPWVGIETVEGAELEVNEGVVSSEGTITVMTVTGQVVATAEGQLDLSTVPAGVYVIVTPEGTAKIVK